MSKLSLRVAKERSNPLGGLGYIMALIPLVLSTVNLAIAITLPIFHYDRFLERAIRQLENRGFLRQWLDNISGFFWQQITPDKIAQNEIWWNQTWAVIYFVISLIFCWLVFKWEEAKYFIAGFSAIASGVIYCLLPVDIFPDFIPAGGSVDDVIVFLISSGTGFTVLGEGGKKRKILQKVRSSAEQKPLKALEILCEEYGLELEVTPDRQDN